MESFGWTLSTDDKTIRDRIFDEMPSIVCDSLLLCAGVGCKCCGGKSMLHLEANSGKRHRTYHSEGPDWAVRLLETDRAVRVDVCLDRPIVGTEAEKLWRSLTAYGVPIFVSYGSGSTL